MALQRTPPKNDDLNKVLGANFGSDPNLHASSVSEKSNANILKRPKRKFDDLRGYDTDTSLVVELKDMMTDIRTQQDERFESLTSAMEAIRKQNSEIKKSVEFMSLKYDEVLTKMNQVLKENAEYKTKISGLESKLELLERNSKLTSIEIRNIPKMGNEDKITLLESTKAIASAINIPVQDSDVREIFRMRSNNKNDGPIIVEFNSCLKRESLIKAVRSHNKLNPQNKLNTSCLNLKCSPRPVYISESLTPMGRRLHYLARQFIKSHKYGDCWTSYGKVYIRKTKEEPRILIQNEEDLKKLANTT